MENATIFDPEEVGFFIRNRMIHDGDLPDFQDYKLWGDSVRFFLDSLDIDNRIVIVPITVTNSEYLQEIIDPLKNTHTINHITLMASKENLKKRLLKRGDKKDSWTYKLVEQCLIKLDDNRNIL